MSKKILLSELPGLKDLEIITTPEGFDGFLKKLRTDFYPEKEKKILRDNFVSWMNTSKHRAVTFFAVHDEPDNFVKNDNWGHYELYRCIAIRDVDDKVYFLKGDKLKFIH